MQWKGSSCCEYDGKSTETGTTWSECSNGGKAFVEQMLSLEEI